MERLFPAEVIKVDVAGQSHIDAYLEYNRIVRDDDGGTPMSESAYERYKQTVGPMRIKNRIYLAWTNNLGVECKQIGPETSCFCQHSYHQHKVDFKTIPKQRPIPQPCQIRGCSCSTFNYQPAGGGGAGRQFLSKCLLCKHDAEKHLKNRPFNCGLLNCKCTGYKTATDYCQCGQPVNQHFMQSETRQERLAKGKPIGGDCIYKAMGGLTGFSSLADGHMRFENENPHQQSLDDHVLNQPISNNDHPILRSQLASVIAYRQANNLPIDERELAELKSQQRREGESELDYYERRYQERQKKSKIYHGPKKQFLKK